MANVLTPVDVYAVVNDMSQQMFGDKAISAVDTSTFATVGEAMLRTGYENTLNALSYTIAKTIFAVRPYSAKFGIVEANTVEFGAFIRKISYFYDGAEQSQDFNTDVAAAQLADGQSIDHYKIRKRYPLEIRFIGSKVLQKHYTRFRKQLKSAFRNEAEFAAFYSGVAVEVNNELEVLRESQNRLTVLNHIAATYNVGNANMKRNLTKEFNDKFGTTYTSAEILKDHFKDFLEFFVAAVKKAVRLMTDNNDLFHLTPVKQNDAKQNLTLLRHTPREYQKLIVNEQFWIDAETRVLPEIFNDNYLKIENYEGVDYWQNPAAPFEINVTPNQLTVETGASVTGQPVNIKIMLAMLFDTDAIKTNYKAEDVITTPINAAGDYYNTYYHWQKNYCNDQTENTIIFYMEDAGK